MKIFTWLLFCSWSLDGGVVSSTGENQSTPDADAGHNQSTPHFTSILIPFRNDSLKSNNFSLICHQIKSYRAPVTSFGYWDLYAKWYCANATTHDNKCLSKLCSSQATSFQPRLESPPGVSSNYSLWSVKTAVKNALSWLSNLWHKEDTVCISCGKSRRLTTASTYPSKLHGHATYTHDSGDGGVEISSVNIHNLMCMVKDATPRHKTLPWLQWKTSSYREQRLPGVKLQKEKLNSNDSLHNQVLFNTSGDIENRSKDVFVASASEPPAVQNYESINMFCLFLWIHNQSLSSCHDIQLSYRMLTSNLCGYNYKLMEKQELPGIFTKSTVLEFPTAGQKNFLRLLLLDDLPTKPNPPSEIAFYGNGKSQAQYAFIYLLTCYCREISQEHHSEIIAAGISVSSFWQNKFIYHMTCCKENSKSANEAVTALGSKPSRPQLAFIYFMTCRTLLKPVDDKVHQSTPKTVEELTWHVQGPTPWQLRFILLLRMRSERARRSPDKQNENDMEKVYGSIYQMKFLYRILQESHQEYSTSQVEPLEAKPILEVHPEQSSFWQHLFLYILKSSRTDLDSSQLVSSVSGDAENFQQAEIITLLTIDEPAPSPRSYFQMKFLWMILYRTLKTNISDVDSSHDPSAINHDINVSDLDLTIKFPEPRLLMDRNLSLRSGQIHLSGNVDAVKLPNFIAMVVVLYLLLKLLLQPLKWHSFPEHGIDLKPTTGGKGSTVAVIRPQFYEIETVVAVIDISPDDLYDLQQRYQQLY